jgi:AcrR family transcriptional regulator
VVRPSRDIDKKLIAAGVELLRIGGATGLSVRKVCARVGVSPGMFSYFFRSKDDFVYQIHQQLYQYFCREISDAVERQSDPRERLIIAMLELAKISHRTRQLFLQLMRDGLNGEPAIARMQDEFVPEDLILVVRLVRVCKAEGVIAKHHDDITVLCLLLGSTVGASLFGDTVHDCLHQHVKRLGPKTKIHQEASVRSRIEIILRGLA